MSAMLDNRLAVQFPCCGDHHTKNGTNGLHFFTAHAVEFVLY